VLDVGLQGVVGVVGAVGELHEVEEELQEGEEAMEIAVEAEGVVGEAAVDLLLAVVQGEAFVVGFVGEARPKLLAGVWGISVWFLSIISKRNVKCIFGRAGGLLGGYLFVA